MLVAPAPSEEATLCAAIGPGAFHGTSESAGPHGSRCTSASLPVGPGITRVSRPSRSCAATSRKAPPLITAASMAVVPMGAPVPNDSRAATRMAKASIASATDSSTAARLGGKTRPRAGLVLAPRGGGGLLDVGVGRRALLRHDLAGVGVLQVDAQRHGRLAPGAVDELTGRREVDGGGRGRGHGCSGWSGAVVVARSA
jgi:hypothetical protein